MSHFSLRRLLWNKKALGAPVGNLIILMAAVVLSSTVVLFAINVTSNQVQKESLFISKTTVDTNTAEIEIKNTGPTSIMVTQITVKGDKFAAADITSNPDVTEGLQKGGQTTLTVQLIDGLITIDDIGRPIIVIVTTTQGAYFTETLVQATEITPPPP